MMGVGIDSVAGEHPKQTLRDTLLALGEAEGGEMFMGKPDRWWADPHWRCINGHVSTMIIKSEARGCDICSACREPVYLTFPEDRDGPLAAAPIGADKDSDAR